MKRFIIICTVFLAATLFFGVPAMAAHELSSVGDIIVDVQDELGNSVTGATVVLQLPSNTPGFTALDDGWDITLTKVDGGSDDDSVAADGDVEFDSNSIAPDFNGQIWNGAAFRATISATGYVDYIINDTYNDSATNPETSANKFTLKIVMKKQAPLSTALSGGTVNVYQNDTVTLITTVVDGGAGDGDSTNNGNIYIAQDPAAMGGGPHYITGEKSGFIMKDNNTGTINDGSQTTYTFSLEYPFAITAQDELGNPVTMTTAAVVVGSGTLTDIEQDATGGTLYWAATGGPGSITITEPGYITQTSTLTTYSYSAVGAQQTLAFQAAGDGPALPFGFLVTAAREIDAMALSLGSASSTFSAGAGITVVDEQFSGGSGYVAAYGSGNMILTVDGYIATATAIAFASAGQQPLAYGDIEFALKVIAYDELGYDCTGCTVTYGGNNHDIALTNTYYLAATSTAALSVASAGVYVTTDSTVPSATPNTSLAAISVNSTTQTVITFGASGAAGETPCTGAHSAGTAATCTGVLYPMKLLVYDELGYTNNMATVTATFGVAGAADAHPTGTNKYYWKGGIAADTLTVSQDGYVDMDNTQDAALGNISADDTGQTLITMTGQAAYGVAINAGDNVTAMGMLYGFKITAQDELGNVLSLNSADATVTPGGNFAMTSIYYNGGEAYVAATDTAPDTFSLAYTGYINTTTPGNWTYNTAAQQTINFDSSGTPDGEQLKYRVRVMVSDELGLAINEADLIGNYYSVNGVAPVAISSASNSLYFQVTAAGPFVGMQNGYVHSPLAGDTALASVVPGTAAQTVVVLSGGAACGGGSIPDGTTVSCNGLQYNVKMDSAKNELSAPLTIDGVGAESFAVYTNPGCTSVATYATGPFYFGSAWYAGVASGTTYYGYFAEPGYAASCDSSSMAPTGAAQLSAAFDGAADGLKYNIKLSDVYTETGTLISTIDGAVGEQLDLYIDGGCTILASTASGPFYFSGAWYAAVDPGTYYGQFTETGYVDYVCDADATVPDGTTQASPSFNGGDGLVYNIKASTAYTELGSLIPVDGDESVAVFTDVACTVPAALASGPVYISNSWYVAAASGTNYYVSFGEPGYVSSCDTAFINPDGTAQLSPAFLGVDGLQYNIKLTSATNELGALLTIDNNEDVSIFTDVSCSAPAAVASGPFYNGNAWYAAAASGTAYYVSFEEYGYVESCDATSITPDGITQISPSFTGADAPMYNIILTTATTELGAPVTIDGDETMALYTDAACTSAAVGVATGPFYLSGAWYAAPASGTAYYASLSEPGYVSTCDATSVTPTGAAQMSPTISGSSDGLKYSIKLSNVYSETSTLLSTIDGAVGEQLDIYTDAGCTVPAAVASGPFYYSGAWYASIAAGTYYAEFTETGYVDDQCDADSIVPAGTAQLSPSFTGADGMVYNIKVDSIFTELAAPITVDGDETIAVYTDVPCSVAASLASGPIYVSGAWYVAAASGTNYYVDAAEPGYVDNCDSAPINPTGAAQLSPSLTGADGLLYNIKLTTAFTELNAPLTIDNTEGMALFTDTSCTAAAAVASGPFYFSGAWYAAAAAGTPYYSIFAETGYVDSCDTTAVTPDGITQMSPSFSGAADGLKYNIKLASANTELSVPLTIDNTEGVALFTDAACTAGAVVASGPFYFSGAWYAAAASGTAYYGELSESGYVTGCDATSITPTGATQFSPTFDGVADGLKYNIKMTNVYTETGTLLSTIDGAAGEQLDIYTDAACSVPAAPISGPFYNSGSWYTAIASGTAYYAEFTETGFVDDQCDADTTTPDGLTQMAPSFNGGDGMVYNIKLDTAFSELNAPLTINNNETVSIFTDAACSTPAAPATGPLYVSGAWYIGAASGTSYYVSLEDYGYVESCDDAAVAPTGAAQVSPAYSGAADGLKYNIKLTSAFTELGAALTIDNTEGMALYTDAACTTPAAVASGPFYFSGAWYSAVASGTAYYGALSESGYVTACDFTSVTPTGAAQLSPDFTGAPDGLKYNIKLSSVSTELSIPITSIDGAAGEQLDIYTDGACSVPAAPASGPFYYSGAWYAAVASGTAYYAEFTETGFVDDQCDADTTTPDGITQMSPSFTGADGLVYNIALSSAESELGAFLTIDGDETFNLYTDASCTAAAAVATGPVYFGGSWYAAAASGTAYYGLLNEPGFVSECDASSVTPTGAAQLSPTFTSAGTDGLPYSVKFTTAYTELGAQVTVDGASYEALQIYNDTACGSAAAVASGPFYYSGAWYAAVVPGAFYAGFTEPGLTSACDDASISPSTTAQVSPVLGDATDILQYTVKITTISEELGNSFTPEASDTVALYSGAGCAGAVAPATGPIYDIPSSAWYVGMDPGSYYTSYSKPGFVNACDTVLVAAATSTQVIPGFVSATLDYSLVIKVNDQYGYPVTGSTLTHGGISPAWSDLGTYANLYYFNVTGAAGLGIVKDGFNSIDETSNSVEPGGGTIGQTFIELTGSTNGDLTTVAATVPGTSVLRNGIVHENNIELTVQYASSTPVGLSGLGNFSNFYFVAPDGSRVTPENFFEVDQANRPGVYHFKVATDTVSIQVKSVDYDNDPQVDFVDSDALVLTGLDATLKLFGPITMYPAADYITVTPATATIQAGATQAFIVSVYDNDGLLVSTGPHSMLDVSVSITGGSVSPASTKDIFSTTLTGASSVAGSADTTVTGSLSGGTANVVITESVVTDGMPIVIAATPLTWSLTQYYKTSTTASMDVDPASLVGDKITIIDPTDTTIDNMATVRIEIQDASGNLVPTVGAMYSFNVSVSGSALISGVATGTISAGAGTATATVQPSSGVVEIYVSDSVVETVNITVNDPSAMAPLDDTSTQNLTFATGTAASIAIYASTPSSQTVNSDISVECRVYDSGGNFVTNSNVVFTLKATGATNASTPIFKTPGTGTAISGTNTSSIAVRSSNGVAIIPLTDTTAQTVGLSLSDSDSTGLTMTSSSNVTFTSGSINGLNITTLPMGLTAGTKSSAYTIQLQDTNGNAVMATSTFQITLSALETAHQSTGKFYDSTSTATGSIYIMSGSDSAVFYYMDTLAGSVTIRASATDVQSDTVAEVVVHAAPINASSVSVSTATKETDTEQPTTLKSRQYYPGTLSTITMVEYPYTDNADYFISANSNKAGVIRITLKDPYGNAIGGETLTINVSGLVGYTVSPANIVTDTSGYAEAFISSPINGTAGISISMSTYTTYNYGKSFTIYFKEEDHTPPQTTRYSSETLVDGDYMDPYGKVNLKIYLDDLGTNAVGVDTSSIDLTVKDPSSFEVSGATTSSCQNLGASASPQYLCTIEWEWDQNVGLSGSSRTKLADGYYTVSLSVMDLNSNELNQSWTLQVQSSSELKDVMSGPGMFDPRSGEPMKIAFQVPADNSYISLEIYDRRGKLVYVISDFKDSGYGEITWDGIVPGGGFAGNGIYMYRLTCSVNGATTSQTGKLAVFKQ